MCSDDGTSAGLSGIYNQWKRVMRWRFRCEMQVQVQVVQGLTVAAGGALPALLTDAAERVSVHHTRSSVLTGTRQTAAVLRCRHKNNTNIQAPINTKTL